MNALKGQKRHYLLLVLMEMYYLLLDKNQDKKSNNEDRGMKLSYDRIAFCQIWPTKPYSHKKSREFLSAVKRDDIKVVRYLLMFTSPFLVFEYDDCKQNALMWAVKRNYAEMTLELLTNYSRINWKDIGGRTALHFAVKN